MKLYHTKTGIIIEKDKRFYQVQGQTWETFINDDHVFNKATKLVAELQPSDDKDLIRDLLPPMGANQELWACGVTYYRSMVGRQEESKDAGGADFYSKVYAAERPECFFKSNFHRIVGNKGLVRIRKDSTWDVPEPELTLVVASSGKIIGYTIGNDMSSRSIEGENPLYLPQAKTYDGCAALGPCVYITKEPPGPETSIHLAITRNKLRVFEGSITIEQMKRKPEELVSFVYRECSFPYGSLIMTGTGIVPGNDFTLKPADEISITIDHIGTLENTVG
jgi:2-dehydro-3-deoxy-D-arabinonate dehydratase